MKRKKSRANKAAPVKNSDGAPIELSVNCSLCLNDESPAYECQQFLFNDLENAFQCSFKVNDKNRFKICVTCSYHISILAKFVNKNICLSGANPLCFMCKSFTVFDILPNDLKNQLKNTPFGAQIEDKGNYYACVVCLYQLMKYQNYKNLIDNYRNGSRTPTINTIIPLKSEVVQNEIATASTVSSSAPTTKTKNGPTVLLQKLDISKFKLTPFVMLTSNELDKFEVSSSKMVRKRSRSSDPIYTEVLPKKRRYEPSPVSVELSSEDDNESLISETRGSAKKSGKRVTINTRPSVMKAPQETTKTPMKSALKPPQKSPGNKAKSSGKLQIKFQPRLSKPRKETPEVVKGSGKVRRASKSPVDELSTPNKSTTAAKSVSPDKSVTPAKTSTPVKSAGRSSRTPVKSSPRLPVKLETKKSPKADTTIDNEDEFDESIPETPTSGRKKRTVTKNFPMKTPAEKKQMVTVQLSEDDDDEAKDGSDVEEIVVENKPGKILGNIEELSQAKITDLIDDQEDDDQAEIIIPEDTDNMEKMAIDEDSEPNQDDPIDNEDPESQKETLKDVKIVEPNTSANSLDGNDENVFPDPAAIDDTATEIAEYIKNSIREEPDLKPDVVAESSVTKAPATATTTSNGNSNSDKENTVDLLRDESNSSDFGVIKKLNNNERVQLDINMDKIFDELRTEATP